MLFYCCCCCVADRAVIVQVFSLEETCAGTEYSVVLLIGLGSVYILSSYSKDILNFKDPSQSRQQYP